MRKNYRRSLSAVAVAHALSLGLAHANPTDPSVMHGSASISSAGKSLTVTNAHGTILNWQSFSIGPGELTRFQQSSSLSAVLNRVVGRDPSAILGSLQSNGRVFLVNPHGIVFGAGALIDTAGFVASTLNIADRDFLEGRFKFEGGGNGVLRNEGTIKAGGDIFLVGPRIENSGLIRSEAGSVLLVAGQSVTITSPDAHGVQFALQAPTDTALNIGTIDAKNAAGMFAGSLRHSGDIRADRADAGEGGRIFLRANAQVVLDAGSLTQARGGVVEVAAPVVLQSGAIIADGASGGRISIEATNYLQTALVSARGEAGAGGEIAVRAHRVIQTSSASMLADGGAGGEGGKITVHADTADGGRLLTSATFSARGERGGEIKLLGRDIVLLGASLDASGTSGGGTILVGGDFQGNRPDVPNAATTGINFSTTLKADALATGDGGKVIVWSDTDTRFYGTASARGGAQSGNGGLMEISGKENLTMGGFADAGAPNGKPGTLLLDPKFIVIDSAGAGGGVASFQLVDPNPGAGNQFAQQVTVLANNNVVTTNPNDDFVAADAGAAYFFSGTTGALISTISGSNAGDRVGSGGAVALTGNNNFVVRSQNWNGVRGAISWGNGVTGFIGGGGAVSAANSLVGTTALDRIGGSGVTALTNGNYVVASQNWHNGAISNAGAVTWGNGAAGTIGAVSAANSLVGSSPIGDTVGSGVTALPNGNYVVVSRDAFNDGLGVRGAVTWVNGTNGRAPGEVSAGAAISSANSLVGSQRHDQVGSGGITVLTNGNYVVTSSNWKNGGVGQAGAVTWGSGTSGVVGVVSAANSLVGSSFQDFLGDGGVTALTNGNYVVGNPAWNGVRGAATWGNGTTGVVGTVSALNSLVGSTADDQVGGAVTALTNGNYVVMSSNWTNGAATFAGAVTWGNGATGTVGAVSAANSLVGSTAFDEVGLNFTVIGVKALTNGNYVVLSPFWNNGAATSAGAVTFGSGTTGIVGAVSAANSLVGTTANDSFGSGGVTALSNGNYVVSSPSWDNGAATNAGAATFGSGTTGIVGAVSAANSLVGTTANDFVGMGVTALTNGNYVVRSTGWNNGAATSAGAVTFGGGTAGISGAVSAANSLVGATANDNVGSSGITALSNGNYVVASSSWSNGAATQAGAVTFGSGTTGIAGAVSASNSLVGTTVGDVVGAFGVTVLSNGDYVVKNPFWNNGAATSAGAVTFGSGTSGVSGAVSAANSLVGTTADDQIGSGGVTPLSNGNVVVRSPFADKGGLVDAGLVHVLSPGGGALSNPLLFSDIPSSSVTITPAQITAISNTGTAVTLQANSDITLAASSNITASAGGAGGALTMQAGRSVLLNSNITTDNGALTIVANERAANGVVDVDRDAGAAVITMAPGTAINAGSGTVTIALRDGAGLTNNASGAITLGAISAGAINLSNNGPTGGGPIGFNGPIAVTGNVTLGGGTLSGAGTITGNVNNTGGTLAPGGSPGTLVINGNYVQGAGGTLAIELGGTTQGVNYDLLQVTGTASLNGALNVAMFGGFAGTAGDAFSFMTYASKIGDFATFSYPAGSTFTLQPGAAQYTLALATVPAPPPPLPTFQSTPASGQEDAVLQLPANQVRTLNDQFFAMVTELKGAEELRKGSALVCR